tara:strand:- start:148 stop:300 length:153 start_codon:yes stop_codon:yes gene_type:complete
MNKKISDLFAEIESLQKKLEISKLGLSQIKDNDSGLAGGIADLTLKELDK